MVTSGEISCILVIPLTAAASKRWSALNKNSISAARGFTKYQDDIAKAPYAFNPERKILVTYDDSASIIRKTEYAIDQKLGGIMFWQLADDKFSKGLLEVMYNTKMRSENQGMIIGL